MESFFEVIGHLEQARLKMEEMRNKANENKWSARALSIAITETETAMLWFTNAKPE